MRKEVFWETNQTGQKSPVKSSFDGCIVVSSDPGQNAPNDECTTRDAYPEAHTLETCILRKHPTSRIYFAYPAAHSYHCILMPGVSSALEIKWQENGQDPGKVIYTFDPEGFETYFRIFPNRDWAENYPKPNEVVLCSIFWLCRDGKVTGIAKLWQENEAVPEGKELGIEELHGHYFVMLDGEAAVTVFPANLADVMAWSNHDEIHIVVRRVTSVPK